MPWPEPREGESEDDFISRCMSDKYIQEDLPEQDQRLAVCYQQWRDRDKSFDKTQNRGVSKMDMERKTFTGIELKKDKAGSFIAKIAELNVIDKDGDVTLPGAFPEGKTILISAYQHGSWMGELPVGKGVIREKGNDVLVDGEFNLKSETGKEHYETVKFAPDLQEWSYGFVAQEFESDTEWEGNHVARILKKLDVFEAAPVLRGAGMNTSVLAIKHDGSPLILRQASFDKDQNRHDEQDKEKQDEISRKGMTFADQAETALAAVEGLVTRAKSLADLRREEGRELSEVNKERLSEIEKELAGLSSELKELTAEPGQEPDPEQVEEVKDMAAKLYLEFIKINNLRGI